MSEQPSAAIKTVTDEVRLQRALAVIEHQVQYGSTIREACDACSVKERSFYRWISDGLLKDYLAECQESRRTAAQAMAAEAVPDVMQNMIELATGRKTVRGASPIAAAQFVLSVAGTGSAADIGKTQLPTLIPQMVQFNIVAGTLVPAALDVIEGEVIEVLPDDGNTPPERDTSPQTK